MPTEVLPPPEHRFHWRRWEPYRYPLKRNPQDPPPDAVIYMLVMGAYEVARIHLQGGDQWLATVGVLWAEKHQREALIQGEDEARRRVLEWAQRRFTDLHRTRPTAYWVVGAPKDWSGPA